MRGPVVRLLRTRPPSAPSPSRSCCGRRRSSASVTRPPVLGRTALPGPTRRRRAGAHRSRQAVASTAAARTAVHAPRAGRHHLVRRLQRRPQRGRAAGRPGTAALVVTVGPILIALLAGILIKEGFPQPLLIGIVYRRTGGTGSRTMECQMGPAVAHHQRRATASETRSRGYGTFTRGTSLAEALDDGCLSGESSRA